jgi:hypothetical protein
MLRWVLFTEAVLACLLYARLTGKYLLRPGWALRLTLTGVGGIMVYVTIAQIKAYLRESPFDLVALVGLISVTTFDAGAIWYLSERRRRG